MVNKICYETLTKDQQKVLVEFTSTHKEIINVHQRGAGATTLNILLFLKTMKEKSNSIMLFNNQTVISLEIGKILKTIENNSDIDYKRIMEFGRNVILFENGARLTLTIYPSHEEFNNMYHGISYDSVFFDSTDDDNQLFYYEIIKLFKTTIRTPGSFISVNKKYKHMQNILTTPDILINWLYTKNNQHLDQKGYVEALRVYENDQR